MAGIENLQSRIKTDYEDRAKQIQADAKVKADEVKSQAQKKAEEIMDNMKAKAEKDGKEKKDRVIARAQLDARNELLFAKHEAINLVINQVIEKVNQMDDKSYLDFVEKLLVNNVETGDEEIIFSERDKARIEPSFIAAVNSKLTAMGKKGMIQISGKTRNIGAGFVLTHGGLEINCTIESQIRLLRDSLEGEISNLLFEGR